MQIIEMNYHNYLDIHLMMVLPNAPLSSPDFLSKHKIKVSYLQPRFSHRSNPTQLVDDLVGFVTATETCSEQEWIEGHQFRWLIIFGHYLGSLQYISRGLNKVFGISFKEFYFKLLDFCKTSKNSFIGKEYSNIKNNLKLILENKRHWGDIIEGAGDINWEVDEASSIRLVKKKPIFYKEIREFILGNFSINNIEYLNDIFKYQVARLHDPFKNYPYVESFATNIHEAIYNADKIKFNENYYYIEGKNFNGDVYNWAKENLWFGRRTAKYKTKISFIDKSPTEEIFYKKKIDAYTK
jgi:hypothetical protein